MMVTADMQHGKTKWQPIVAATVFLIASLAGAGFAAEEPIGRTNWVEGYISGFGMGLAEPGANQGLARASSIRAAKLDALRNLLKTIHQLGIDPRVRVESYVVSDDIVGERVSGLVKGAQMVDQKIQWLNNAPLAVVEMRICIDTFGKGCGSGNTLVSALDLVAFRDRRQRSRGAFFQPSVSPVAASPGRNRPVTGVVFSLGGLAYSRILLPVVVTSAVDGVKTVYSAHQVAPGVLGTRGIVRYADTLGQVPEAKRVGSNYLVVPVERIDEEKRLVISKPSATRISDSISGGGDYLREARVVISAE